MKKLVLLVGISLLMVGTAFAQKGLIAIITPPHDNPFFKAEADAAQAQSRGARLRDPGFGPRRRRQQTRPTYRYGHRPGCGRHHFGQRGCRRHHRRRTKG